MHTEEDHVLNSFFFRISGLCHIILMIIRMIVEFLIFYGVWKFRKVN